MNNDLGQEVITEYLAAEAFNAIKANPMFSLLCLLNSAKTENKELASSIGEVKNMQPEHQEQLAYDGFEVIFESVRSVVKKMDEMFSKANTNIEELVETWMKENQ